MKAILVVTGLGILALLAELFRFRKVLFPLIILGLLGAIGAALSYWWFDDGEYAKYFNNMIRFEESSVIMSVIILSTTLLWFLMSNKFLSDDGSRSDLSSLVLFSVVGALVLTSYTNMTMLFLGVEMLSIPLYVLAGSKKNAVESNEAAFKYFLLGSFASAFLLFGIALIYGATGSFDLAVMGEMINTNIDKLPGFFYGGVIMLLIGLLFKISAAPFHFWAPDVYQGAPTQVTAFMSTIVKTAAIVTIMRLFLTVVFSGIESFWTPILAFSTGLTFIIGNVTAVVQEKVKRILAFSSISHAGFLLLAVAAYSAFSAKAIIFYTAAYSVASILAFTVLINVMEQQGGDDIRNFEGLSKRNPLLALCMTIALLSLAGIPPTAGFFGKYYVFNAALESGHAWLVILGILSSLVGVYYYFRIIIAMYFKPASDDRTLNADATHQLLLFVTAVATIVLGLLPDLLLNIGSAAANVTP